MAKGKIVVLSHYLFDEKMREWGLNNQNVDKIGLLGGEPLIHPRITDFAKIARKYFPLERKKEPQN